MIDRNVAELHHQSVLLYQAVTCPKTYKILHHLLFSGPLQVLFYFFELYFSTTCKYEFTIMK